MKNRIFGIVVITLLLVMGSNESFAQKTELDAKRNATTIEQKKERVIQSRTQKQLLLWQKRLDLTDAQVTELEVVLAEYINSIQRLKADESLSDTEKKAAAKTLRKDYDAQFRTYLTDAQKEKFDNLRGERKKVKAEESRELKAK